MAYENRFEASRFTSRFSSRFGSEYGQYHAPKPPPSSKKGAPGVFGFLENLVTDVGDMVTGLPMGLYTIATQSPTKTGKDIGLAWWQDWAPLVKGDVDKWWDQFTAHPLGPILDIAGLVTFGAGTAVKGTSMIAKAGKATGVGGVVLKPESVLTKIARATGGSSVMKVPVTAPGVAAGTMRKVEVVGRGSSKTIKAPGVGEVYKHYKANPVVRMRQRGFEQLGQKISGSKTTKTTDPQLELLKGPTHVVDKFERMQTPGGVRGRLGRGGAAGSVNRALDKEISTRKHGFKAALFSAMETSRMLFDPHVPQAQKQLHADAVHDNMKGQFLEHGMRLGMRKKGGSKTTGAGYTMIADPKYHTDVEYPKTWDADGLKDYYDRMAKEGGWMTDDPTKALRDADGTIRIVRKDSLDGYAGELKKSTEFLSILWHKPTLIWKAAVLAYSPRFFINNVVGNSIMYWMATNPAAAARGLYEAYRENNHVRGMTAAERLTAGPFKKNLAYESQGMGSAEVLDDMGRNASWDRKARLKQKAKSGLYGVTHEISEDVFRQATMHWAARRTPEYWALRSTGHSHEGAVQASMSLPKVRAGLRNELDDVLGNYSHLTKAERQIKNVVPFYTWDRAILRHTKQMVLNRPYEAAALAHIGEYGHESFIEKFGGKLPHFLFNSIPLDDKLSFLDHIPGFDKIAGRENVLSTAGLNPYGTVGELLAAGGGVVGIGDRRPGETIGAQLNPLLAGAIESISGTKLISGAPAKQGAGGLLGNVYGNAAESVPQARLIQTLISGRPTSQAKDPSDRKPLLFRGDASQQLLSMLGAPVKRFNKQTAEEIYWRQQGGDPTGKRWKPSSDNSNYAPNFGELPGL